MSTTTQQPAVSFDDFIATSDRPVLVDFWAEWCGPCHMVAPTLEDVAREYSGRAYVIKVNVDTKPHVAAKFQIQSIPTLILFHEGKPVWRQSGVQPKHVLTDLLDRYVQQ